MHMVDLILQAMVFGRGGVSAQSIQAPDSHRMGG